MQNSTQFSDDVEPQTMLQVRIFHRDETGAVRDSTYAQRAYGLAWLQGEGRKAVAALIRIREFLELLALAAEERDELPADLVKRVLDEIEDEFTNQGDLGWYVRSMEQFFQYAEALPPARDQEGVPLDPSLVPAT